MSLTQDKVNEYACRYLSDAGWTVTKQRAARRPGQDTVAERDGVRLVIAPSGNGSSLPSSSRYGKDFTRSQVFQRRDVTVARMVRYAARGSLGALAVPDTPLYREAVGEVLPSLKRLDVGVLWVGDDGSVVADLP